MNEMNLAYCIECEDLVEFETKRKVLKEVYKGDLVQFEFNVGSVSYTHLDVYKRQVQDHALYSVSHR